MGLCVHGRSWGRPWEMVVGTSVLQERVRAGRDPGGAAMGRGADGDELQVEEHRGRR